MRDRHSRRHNNWKKDNNSGNRKERRDELARPSKPAFRPSTQFVSQDQVRQEDSAISEYKKENRPLCSYCGEAIYDMSSAMNDPSSHEFVHFDCVLEKISSSEQLGTNDKISYIGQGRFGIINYANIHDTKHFTIKKIIDWEEKDKRESWRDEVADLYSKVK